MKMNVYITTKDLDIQGFAVFQVSENHYNFDSVPQNSCNEVIIEDAVEYMDDIPKFLNSCCSLVRKGGVIRIFGMDLRSVCLSYVSSQMNTQTFNQVVTQDKRGAISLHELNQIIKSLGMDIQKSSLNENAMYEVVAIRK